MLLSPSVTSSRLRKNTARSESTHVYQALHPAFLRDCYMATWLNKMAMSRGSTEGPFDTVASRTDYSVSLSDTSLRLWAEPTTHPDSSKAKRLVMFSECGRAKQNCCPVLTIHSGFCSSLIMLISLIKHLAFQKKEPRVNFFSFLKTTCFFFVSAFQFP